MLEVIAGIIVKIVRYICVSKGKLITTPTPGRKFEPNIIQHKPFLVKMMFSDYC